MSKELKGEKYIYLLMGYILAKKEKNKRISIGKDNGMTGGQNYWRAFEILEYDGKTLLIERKLNKSFAGFSRAFEIIDNGDRPKIYEYINESGENGSKTWIH